MEIVLRKNEIHYRASEMQILLHGFGISVSNPGSLAEHARRPGLRPKEITVLFQMVTSSSKKQEAGEQLAIAVA